MGGSKFEVEISGNCDCGKDCPTSFIVKGFHTTYYRERKTGHPDTWTPAEGGVLEDLEIRYPNGCMVATSLHEQLIDNGTFMDRVREALENRVDN